MENEIVDRVTMAVWLRVDNQVHRVRIPRRRAIRSMAEVCHLGGRRRPWASELYGWPAEYCPAPDDAPAAFVVGRSGWWVAAAVWDYPTNDGSGAQRAPGPTWHPGTETFVYADERRRWVNGLR